MSLDSSIPSPEVGPGAEAHLDSEIARLTAACAALRDEIATLRAATTDARAAKPGAEDDATARTLLAAVDQYRELAEEDPDNYSLQYATKLAELAKRYHALRRFQEAEEKITEAIDLYQASRFVTTNFQRLGYISALFTSAHIYEDTDRSEKMMDTLKLAAEIATEPAEGAWDSSRDCLPELFRKLSMLHESRGDKHAAIKMDEAAQAAEQKRNREGR